jgi:FixJ family two-component response regulator
MAPDEGEALVIVIAADAVARLWTVRALQAMPCTVEACTSAEAFLRRPPRDSPMCLILDGAVPGLRGLELQVALAGAAMPLIVLTGPGTMPLAVPASIAGAVAFLPTPCPLHALQSAVGDALTRARVAAQQRAAVAPLLARYARLTPRERTVMARVTAGQSRQQIAVAVGLHAHRVQAYRRRILHKMQAASRAELVRMADQLGLAHVP